MPLGHLGIPLLPFLAINRRDIDLRLLWIGALLPDIIDKPLGHLLLPENNGRIYAHTLIFAFIVFSAALAYRPLMPVSLGVSMHQLLDGMFLDIRSSVWPLLGHFEATDYEVINWIYAYGKPFTLFEELIGAAAILMFVVPVIMKGRPDIIGFVRTGRLDKSNRR